MNDIENELNRLERELQYVMLVDPEKVKELLARISELEKELHK